jgi:hypothetical protein
MLKALLVVWLLAKISKTTHRLTLMKIDLEYFVKILILAVVQNWHRCVLGRPIILAHLKFWLIINISIFMAKTE